MSKAHIVREYLVGPRNSTVCGYPGRQFDWSKFCWDGSEVYVDRLYAGVPKLRQAPLPCTDSFFIAPNCQYIHVPYDWTVNCTIYRVRPNDCMYAGRIYRNHKVVRQSAVLKEDGWYWRLEMLPDAEKEGAVLKTASSDAEKEQEHEANS